ncbi:16S rRNA (guanine(966)-N(2))-methyltransferase RsmD [Solirubrobacter sp. CPCC 204708]|uniref:16S rRNA (Guanine(966)-N(2))-methyltransferase RsmD n=1 Tax=Solirubrobacter deserti TaxID=2282478 RepID=A0ABT4RRJ4_9ACTN|nr:16S rRNA (guanine(966)-N(2))-methyltransferase RsmD [Solirubrobacter deserti]MBE2314789.1 16S rRNA (guanine(966)-N(2))-methyltransferase RsmD [Solirubrobacter deserti]MDA0141199.1 16S rRNA (guanine(966)-N(2))-methyltransferase RsmD [Solirubrobacter deserti]
MRVIAGNYGGRTLKAPPGDATRPTSDRVREALFSILGTRTEDARVLDLFAGSGALGLEALSRGAESVTFVDDAHAAVKVIRANLEALKAHATVKRGDALRLLTTASISGEQYDLVFLDPPYRHAERLAQPLSEALPAVLAPGAVVVAESDRRAPLTLTLPLTDERRYGDTLIRIYGP